MPAQIIRLSEGDSHVVNAAADARKRISVGSGNVSFNDDHAESDIYEPIRPGYSTVVERASAVRGPGVVAVADVGPGIGHSPDSSEPKPAPKVESSPKKKRKKKS